MMKMKRNEASSDDRVVFEGYEEALFTKNLRINLAQERNQMKFYEKII